MKAPRNGTTIVPTLPPEMWALMAKPRRCSGKASDSSAFPTGCCGEAPMRARLIDPSSWPTDWASPPSISAPPNTSCPPASRLGRGTYRVTKP